MVSEQLSSCRRPISASIDVPGRRSDFLSILSLVFSSTLPSPFSNYRCVRCLLRGWTRKGEVDMDELMAALVLSSLSSSPLLHGPAHMNNFGTINSPAIEKIWEKSTWLTHTANKKHTTILAQLSWTVSNQADPPTDCTSSKFSKGGGVSGNWRGCHGSRSPAMPPEECLYFEPAVVKKKVSEPEWQIDLEWYTSFC